MFEIVQICNFAPEQYNNYLEANKMLYDYENTIDYAREEGHRAGFAEGEAKGEMKKAMEVAKTMKGLGIDTDLIVKSTGLTEEEVRKL